MTAVVSIEIGGMSAEYVRAANPYRQPEGNPSMNRDAETVPARHETPDVAELRDQIAGTIHRRICEHSREDCIENLGNCERATDSAMPLISTALDEGHAMARLLADALKDAIRTLRELAEKAVGEPIPFGDSDLYAEVVDGALDAAAERDALRAELAHMTEARDNARAEVERLAALVAEVRKLHEPAFWYTDECCDPECDRECVELWVGERFHADVFERVCETCSGGDLSMVDDGPALWPCPTIRALDEEPQS